jgi:hypothetical protein
MGKALAKRKQRLVPLPLDKFFEPVTRDIRETKTVVERIKYELECVRDELHRRSDINAIDIMDERIAEYSDVLVKMDKKQEAA